MAVSKVDDPYWADFFARINDEAIGASQAPGSVVRTFKHLHGEGIRIALGTVTGDGRMVMVGRKGAVLGQVRHGVIETGQVIVTGGPVGELEIEALAAAVREAGTSWDAAGRAARVERMAGGTRKAAALLGVQPSTITRWVKGERVPAASQAAALVDLEYVLTRVSFVYPHDAVAADWLTTANAFLDDRRPIDVLRDEGPGEVIAALDSEAAGSYA